MLCISLDLTLPPGQSFYRDETSSYSQEIFRGLRNYLSLFAFVLFFFSGLIYILPLRFSFNAYRGPSASSTTPSLKLGSLELAKSRTATLDFSSFFHFVLITCLAHAKRGVKCKGRSSTEGREGVEHAWNSIPVCAFSRRIENAANGTSVC